MLSTFCIFELDKTIASWLIVVLDANSCTNNFAEWLKSFMKIFMWPVCTEAFDEHIAFCLTTSEKFFVVG